MKKILMILGALVIVAMFAVADDTPYGPTIVAKVALTGQTSSVGSTTIYTPAVDGDYHLSCYIVANGLGQGQDEIAFQWTDEIQSESGSCATNSSGSGISSRNESTIHVAAGTPIKYSSTVSFTFGTAAAFDAFIVVVKE